MTLHDLANEYVVLKRSSGSDFGSGAKILGAFARALGANTELPAIGKDQVLAFLNGSGPFTDYWRHKYYILAALYRYAISRGYATETPLPAYLPKRPASLVPYIYSRDEIRGLLDAANRYRKQGLHLEPDTFRAILLTLYGAALRISEAVNLNQADVDTHNAVLTIRETKFYKTRLVPVGSDLNRVLSNYWHRTLRCHGTRTDDAPFFVDRKGARLLLPTIRQAFSELRAMAGVRRSDGGRYQPRLHDLRHSSAVHRLTAWYAQGADVQRLLPRLSTYLGHYTVAATQKYLTMTPELLREASARFEKYVFGEVWHD
ncbi:MAG: integrase [Acidobacteria bacterium]|nr:MAG: integrase [Acidobacteriota bacterium]